MKIRYHRPIPDNASINEVTFKKETTGEWFVSFGLETNEADLPEKADVESLDATDSVGIDLGVLSYLHTSDGTTVDWRDPEAIHQRGYVATGVLVSMSHSSRDEAVGEADDGTPEARSVTATAHARRSTGGDDRSSLREE